jgi:type I restriction enzyme S subunit
LEPAHYLSKNTKGLGKYLIESGQLLLARSGSGGLIGCVTLATKTVNNTTASDHVIRICPDNNKINTGYLYVYLNSSIGYKELLKHASGTSVPAIRPEAIRSIGIPKLASDIQNKLGNLTHQAFKCRDEAIDRLNEASRMFHTSNSLPILNFENKSDPLEWFQVESSEIFGNKMTSSGIRLDAHHFNPAALHVVANIQKCSSEVKTLKNVANVFMGQRFKRNYVEAARGVPFLSGTNIIQIRPNDLRHLSNIDMSEMQDLILKQGWTLITRSGTIGRCCFVWNNFEEWAATEDIIRVAPNDQVDKGYLPAFLASEYGYQQIMSFRHGSVIDHITPEQLKTILVPIPSKSSQEEIGDLVRKAYELRSEAIRFEDEAQKILMNELTNIAPLKEV